YRNGRPQPSVLSLCLQHLMKALRPLSCHWNGCCQCLLAFALLLAVQVVSSLCPCTPACRLISFWAGTGSSTAVKCFLPHLSRSRVV
ncbi:hypothetical protein GGX14DRAFT_473142, partial [Mycena pura]